MAGHEQGKSRHPNWLGCAAMNVFGTNVTRARHRLGWTLRDLARESKINPGKLSRLERGKETADPRIASQLASALGTTPEELSRPYDPAPVKLAPGPGKTRSPDDHVPMDEIKREFWAASSKLQRVAARMSRQKDNDPRKIYALLEERIDALIYDLYRVNENGGFRNS